MKWLTQAKIILWAFLGVRSQSGREEDAQSIKNPLVFLAVALILFFIFVFGLIILVNVVV